MTRSRIITTLTAVGLTALTLSALPGNAQASDAPIGPAANGKFYAYQGVNRGGGYCAWTGSDADWESCPTMLGGIRNQASSLQNSGYPGSFEDVDVFWGLHHTGAWYCLGNGRYLADLRNYRFGPNGGGHGDNETLNNNISSHNWSDHC
ncbi:putative secreted protein [Streptomyces davaonensis JCM 4913]|uniref:Putative secreted protein n=1 Tax=Streptomyces davaonensis (strain DSM 101723 / JCM 4913 / KCC S-0913 / 768) TaxID=1214101 RepID=K4RAX4_STRDJ|nr:hypothetical protein [Streptomyces davaonensis]CCK30315.1 putative secreted protein [Streptomyces davaonensis JCM 4913]